MAAPQQRHYELDALRIFACILIVVLHSPMPTTSGYGLLLGCISYFCISGVCLFFMLSGYLLLPVSADTATFLKRRLSKLIWPAVIWSLVYMSLHHYIGNEPVMLKNLLSIPFSNQGTGILWYLYALISIYCILPIISPWLKNVSAMEAKIYLWLFIAVFCLPVVSQFLYVNTTYDGPFYYLCGYGGYVYTAWFIKRYPDYIKIKYPVAVVVAAMLFAAIGRVFSLSLDFYTVYWTKSIFLLALSVVWFKVFIRLKEPAGRLSSKAKCWLAMLSNLTFGIYLMHMAVIKFMLWRMPMIADIANYPVQILVISVASFTISAIICYAISLTPAAKYIIGYTAAK